MSAPANKPLPPGIVERLRAYHEEHPTWGSLHIVMDDGNLEDSHVQFCVEWAEKRGDTEGAELGRHLLTQSQSQRDRLSRRL